MYPIAQSHLRGSIELNAAAALALARGNNGKFTFFVLDSYLADFDP
jgi:hypothetical protein